MKSHIMAAILILLFITACNGTFEVSLEHSSTGADSPAVTSIMAPVPTGTLVPLAPTDSKLSPTVQAPASTLVPPAPIDPQLSPSAQSPTDTPAPADSPAQHMVQIFLIAVDDNGQTGIPIGCGDSAVPVQVETPLTQGVLKAALVALLSVKDQYYGQSGLYNALYQSDLQVESVSIKGGKASVYLTGSLIMGGECDTPRVQAQLEHTVLQFPTVTEAAIFINGKPLADALSLKGG